MGYEKTKGAACCGVRDDQEIRSHFASTVITGDPHSELLAAVDEDRFALMLVISRQRIASSNV